MKKNCSQISIPGSSLNDFPCTVWYSAKRNILFLLHVPFYGTNHSQKATRVAVHTGSSAEDAD